MKVNQPIRFTNLSNLLHNKFMKYFYIEISVIQPIIHSKH